MGNYVESMVHDTGPDKLAKALKENEYLAIVPEIRILILPFLCDTLLVPTVRELVKSDFEGAANRRDQRKESSSEEESSSSEEDESDSSGSSSDSSDEESTDENDTDQGGSSSEETSTGKQIW